MVWTSVVYWFLFDQIFTTLAGLYNTSDSLNCLSAAGSETQWEHFLSRNMQRIKLYEMWEMCRMLMWRGWSHVYMHSGVPHSRTHIWSLRSHFSMYHIRYPYPEIRLLGFSNISITEISLWINRRIYGKCFFYNKI